MRRRAFAATLAAFAAVPAAASAEGGIERDRPRVPSPPVRILIATGRDFGAVDVIDDRTFRYDGRTYRGQYALATLDDGRTGLLSVLALEDYLYGVVGREMPPSWPAQALAAQAIVSRTYSRARLRPQKPYDLVAGVADQVYGGMDAEDARVRAAVDGTAGLVVAQAGRAAAVAYSSCCGGHTASAVDVWGKDAPSLRGVVDPNCAGTPHYRWQTTVASARIVAAFATQLSGTVAQLGLMKIDPSGRPRTIALVGGSVRVDVAASEFRARIGAASVPSTLLFSATPTGSGFALAGGGSGHGVGMCQWGARGLALAGKSASDIVAFYFASSVAADA